MRSVLCLGVVALLFVSRLPCVVDAADGDSPTAASPLSIQDVRIGVAGFYKVGRWTPIEVDIEATSSFAVQLVVGVTDPDRNRTRQPASEVTRTGGKQTLQGQFIAGQMDGVIRVDIESSGQVLAHRTLRPAVGETTASATHVPLTMTTQLWLVDEGTRVFEVVAERINGTGRLTDLSPPVVVVSSSGLSRFPDEPGSLNAVDVVVMTQFDDMSVKASENLREWVSAGGHLVVAGSDAKQFEASPLSTWLPVRVEGDARVRDLSGLTRLLPGQEPLRISTMNALRFDYDAGQSLATGLDGPLLARMPLGFGRVTLLALDLANPPLSTWSGLGSLCELLADYEQTRRRASSASLGRSQSGVTDMQTQLAAALDQFPQINKPSNRLVMGLILLYVLAIGPLDYLLVHRLLKRPHWTWVTMPLLVLTGTGMAVRYAGARTPSTVNANQLDLIDIDLTSRTCRLNSWLSFLSPESQRYAIDAALNERFAPQDATPSVHHVSWTGIPGTGFRGMYRLGGLDLARPSYSFAPNGVGILDLPVAVRSTGSITSHYLHELPADVPTISGALVESSGQLNGSITNDLDVPISDWILVHANRVYRPSEGSYDPSVHKLLPGETLTLNDRNKVIPRVLKGYLTGVRRTLIKRTGRQGDDVVAGQDVYDPLDRDLLRLVRTLSFFEAAGGREYTGIDNQALSSLDLTPLLHLDRAVLFGVVDLEAQQLLVDGTPPPTLSRESFIRVLLPVERTVAPAGVRLSPRVHEP